jgi:hypothetical protein
MRETLCAEKRESSSLPFFFSNSRAESESNFDLLRRTCSRAFHKTKKEKTRSAFVFFFLSCRYMIMVNGSRLWSELGANLRELAVGQRLGEDAVVDESESVPLGGTFGLEVPEDPAKSC